MSRTAVSIREAVREDVPVLVDLWHDAIRRADRADQVAELELVVKNAAASPEQRILIAEVDGRVAGAVLLELTTISPLNLEPCVQSIQPRVLEEFQRRGVGHALVEAATSYAEEHGVLHINAWAPTTSREAQRFMARLGLAPVATYRLAPVSVVRSKLDPTRGRGLARVLATRRSQRRARETEVVEVVPPADPIAPE